MTTLTVAATSSILTVAVPQFLCLTPTQRAALELYDMGFSIGPTKPASKLPYLWRRLAQVRIQRDYIPKLFDNRAGLFVMVGRISRNLTILDCETEDEADYHAREFAKRGLCPWRVATARGGHFWWLSAEGELANVPQKNFLAFNRSCAGAISIVSARRASIHRASYTIGNFDKALSRRPFPLLYSIGCLSN